MNYAACGQNLESACKAYAARRQREKDAEYEARQLAAIDSVFARFVETGSWYGEPPADNVGGDK